MNKFKIKIDQFDGINRFVMNQWDRPKCARIYHSVEDAVEYLINHLKLLYSGGSDFRGDTANSIYSIIGGRKKNRELAIKNAMETIAYWAEFRRTEFGATTTQH